MSRTYRNVPVFLTALVVVVVGQSSQIGNSQTSSKKQNTLAIVPKPKDAEIRRIRSAEEWPNPYIVVYSSGFELVLGHGGDAIKRARAEAIWRPVWRRNLGCSRNEVVM